MKRWAVVIATAVLTCGWIVGRTQKAAAQEAATAEIRGVLEEYVRAFSSQRGDLIAERVYMAPSFTMAAPVGGNAGIVTSMTAAEVKTRFESVLKGLAAQNYQRSEIKDANICVLNDVSAIVSARFTRYRKDGSVLSEPVATYVFAKGAQGWRILAATAHTPDRMLKCGA
jgi:hypothetical protein